MNQDVGSTECVIECDLREERKGEDRSVDWAVFCPMDFFSQQIFFTCHSRKSRASLITLMMAEFHLVSPYL